MKLASHKAEGKGRWSSRTFLVRYLCSRPPRMSWCFAMLYILLVRARQDAMTLMLFGLRGMVKLPAEVECFSSIMASFPYPPMKTGREGKDKEAEVVCREAPAINAWKTE